MRKKASMYAVIAIAVLVIGFAAIKWGGHGKSLKSLDADGQPDESLLSKELSRINFGSGFSKGSFEPDRESFVIAQSDDGNKIFYIKPSFEESDGIGVNIKGDVGYYVDLFFEDKESGINWCVGRGIPMVGLAKFSHDERYIAFCGGKKLTIFDIEKKETVFKEYTEDDFVNYFGWGIDENKIYTEFKASPNGNIYDMEGMSVIRAHESEEDSYCKGIIDSMHYYCTANSMSFDSGRSRVVHESNTMMFSKDHGKIAEFSRGRFRGNCEMAFIQTGGNEFGIDYIKDVSNGAKPERITDQYVYDVKFVKGGSVAYIVQSPESGRNSFIMHIFPKGGEDAAEKSVEVSGSSFATTPDGRYGFVGGSLAEIIDFETGKILSSLGKGYDDPEKESIYKAISGAFEILYKYRMTGVKDIRNIDRFYADTEDPSQWANFDLKSVMSERERPRCIGNSNYILSIRVDYLRMKSGYKEPRAGAKLRVFGQNSSGQRFGDDYSVELVKKGENWYVTGLGTFPGRHERDEAIRSAKKYLETSRENEGSDYEFNLQDASIGQVQFWNGSKAKVASEIEYADFCKLYLIVDGEDEKEIYKMVMEKGYGDSWEFKYISDEDLSGI